MEKNDDSPEDVKRATSVEREIKRGQKDDTFEGYPRIVEKKKRWEHCDKPSLRKTKQTEKSNGECCEKQRGRKKKSAKFAMVSVFGEPCTFPKLDIIPRHCLTKEDYIDMLATPSRKCPPDCHKKMILRKLKPVSQRIKELAQPNRQRMLITLQQGASILPPALLDNLVRTVEKETCLTPEQAAQVSKKKKSRGKKRKGRAEKWQSKEAVKLKKANVGVTSTGPSDKDAISCQYLMAERFVRSILKWKCSLPKAEFKDVAEVIVKRLVDVLEYSVPQDEDRKSQQLRYLADVIACWITGVLSEVAQYQEEKLIERCKKKEEEMRADEEVEDEEEEDEDRDEDRKRYEEEEEDRESDFDWDEDLKAVDEQTETEETAVESEVGKEMEEELEVDVEQLEADDKVDEEEVKPEDEVTEVELAVEAETETQVEPEVQIETEIQTEPETGVEEGVEETTAATDSAAAEAEIEVEAKAAEETEAAAEIEVEAAAAKVAAAAEVMLEGEEEKEAAAIEVERTEGTEEEKAGMDVEAEMETQAVEEGPITLADEQEITKGEDVPLQEEKDAEVTKPLEEEEKEEEEVTKPLEEEEKEEEGKEEIETEIPTEEEPSKVEVTVEKEIPKDIDIIKGFEELLKTDLPFLTFDKIIDTIYKMIESTPENTGEDPITNGIHRAIYEKLSNIVMLENSDLLTEELKTIMNVVCGKIANWLRSILTKSQIAFMERYMPEVESKEIRDWTRWLEYISDVAKDWNVWLRSVIEKVVEMENEQITRGEWYDLTRSIDSKALLWRRFHLQTLHQAHRNVTMLTGRHVVKTGTKGLDSEQLINTTDLRASQT